MASIQAELSPFRRFLRLLQPDKADIRNLYLYAAFAGIINLSLPLGIQAIINLIQGGQVSTSWIVLVVFVVLGIAYAGTLQILQLRVTERLQQNIFSRASFEFAFRIHWVKMEELYKKYAPELMNRFFDVMTIQKGLPKLLIDVFSTSLQALFGLILLSFYHPFFIAFSLTVITLVVLILKYTGRKGLETSLTESKHKYKVAHWLEEIARSHVSFKLAGNASLPLERMDEQTGDYLHSRRTHFRILMQQYSLLVVFKVIVATGLLVIGGMLVLDQQMNIGQFVAAEILILMIVGAVEKLILSLETVYDVLTSIEKVGQITDLELDSDDGLVLKSNTGTPGIELDMEGLTFAYPGQPLPVINNLSLHVKAGEACIITGPNSSGKSTLLNLVLGLYRPASGSLLINGMPIDAIRRESLWQQIGCCLADESLFQGTIYENISLGRSHLSEADIQEACSIAQLEPYLKSTGKGLLTAIDPQGSHLPKSVAQRILLARAITGSPGLLVLENPLDDLKQADRIEIIKRLTRSDKGWTILVVSTEPFWNECCSRVIAMENGAVAGNS